MILGCLLQLGRLEEAVARGAAALQKFPQTPGLRLVYGAVLQTSGEAEKGWQMRREAYLADPSTRIAEDPAMRSLATQDPDFQELHSSAEFQEIVTGERRELTSSGGATPPAS